MGVYLEDNPPARSQYRLHRRAQVTGAIVVHTAENNPDLVLPDGGAEGVASFISRRTDAAGSYHSVVDSDSIVRVGEYEWEMFHEGTGGNRWSLGLSFACRASQWPDLPSAWVVGAVRNGAQEAANMAAWVKETTGITVPNRRLTPEQYRSGEAGFIGHGELDPDRRSDPGERFPWGLFQEEFEKMTAVDEPVKPGPLPWGELPDLSNVQIQVQCLYACYRPEDKPGSWTDEVKVWMRDISEKVMRGEDPAPTLAYIEWRLREAYEEQAPVDPPKGDPSDG